MSKYDNIKLFLFGSAGFHTKITFPTLAELFPSSKFVTELCVHILALGMVPYLALSLAPQELLIRPPPTPTHTRLPRPRHLREAGLAVPGRTRDEVVGYAKTRKVKPLLAWSITPYHGGV